MSAAPWPAWPTSRVLAGWWPQLAPYRPSGLWVLHLLLHRIEAAVGVARNTPQEKLDQAVAAVLRSLTEAHPGLISIADYPALAAHAAKLEAMPVFQTIMQPFIPPT